MTFDTKTTTDTEVAWIRSALITRERRAARAHLAATDDLDDRRTEYRRRLRDRQTAREVVRRLEGGITQLAITGFMTDGSHEGGPLGPNTLDSVAADSLTRSAAHQLVDVRRQAMDDLRQANAAVDESGDAFGQSELHTRETLNELEIERATITAFELRANEQQRQANDADWIANQGSSDIELASVAGTLVVSADIEPDIDRLIANARLRGIDLGGGGHRTVAEQIALRIANCDGEHPPEDQHPTPDSPSAATIDEHLQYVLYEAPPSSCSPPTAIPGESEHQAGRAIDFTENGAILSQTSPAFGWLHQNAAAYGLINLPSEPWHWSTTGR